MGSEGFESSARVSASVRQQGICRPEWEQASQLSEPKIGLSGAWSQCQRLWLSWLVKSEAETDCSATPDRFLNTRASVPDAVSLERPGFCKFQW